MINFQSVSKRYGSTDPVLDSVTFIIDRGSFVYLVGPTGSGKTTIFRLIIGDIAPSEGVISMGDWELTKLPKSKITELRRRVGVVFQDLKLLMDRTVIENVILPLEFAGVTGSEAKSRAEQIINEVGLLEKLDQFPLQLSGGERQRVAIARALVFDPEVILADEPTGNLDTKTSFQILDLLKKINKKGTTVFMATHNDKLIDQGIDRVIVLENGKIVDDKKPTVKHTTTKEKKEHEKVEKKEKEESSLNEKINLESLAEKK